MPESPAALCYHILLINPAKFLPTIDWNQCYIIHVPVRKLQVFTLFENISFFYRTLLYEYKLPSSFPLQNLIIVLL